MAVRIDSNGKVFTDQVRKQKVVCTMQTLTQRIRGCMFKDPDARTKDDLNVPTERFIAITDAEVIDPVTETVMQRAPFLIVNKQHIVWVVPDDSEFVRRSDDDGDGFSEEEAA